MDQLIKEVRELLKNVANDSYVRSTCPDCFGMPIILGDHRCSVGWGKVKNHKANEIALSMKINYEYFSKTCRDWDDSYKIKND